jgi:hypothetical protein
MDGILRYMPAVFVLGYLFETFCSVILLFLWIFRMRLLSVSSRKVLGRPNFFGDN